MPKATIDFFAAARKDPALAGRLHEAIAANDRAAAAEAIADLAALAGFEIGPADVEAFCRGALAEIEGARFAASTVSVARPFMAAIGGFEGVGSPTRR